MQDWIIYAVAIFLFFLTHSIPVRPANKARIVHLMGRRGFTLGYSALSIAALSLVIIAANRAPIVQLWPWAPWQNHVTLLAMAVATTIAALAIARPNPLSFGGRNNHLFDPQAPGIVGWIRHPLLMALLLWALGHLVPNGNLAHVILFGVFGGFSILAMKLFDRRKKRMLGEAEWQGLTEKVAKAPFWSIPQSWVDLGFRIAAGGLVFLLLLKLHPVALGVSPMP